MHNGEITHIVKTDSIEYKREFIALSQKVLKIFFGLFLYTHAQLIKFNPNE